MNTTEKVICSPWVHPSGIQQHKPNLYLHQHIINPHTWLYWKNLMKACLQKQYCNTISDRNILDIQCISFSYAMSTAYHKCNLRRESGFIFTCTRTILQRGWQKVGKKLKTYCCDSSNTGDFSLLANKSCNKQACDQMTDLHICNPPCSKCYCHLHYWEHDGSQFALCLLWTSKTHTLSSLVVAICIITLLPTPSDAVLT